MFIEKLNINSKNKLYELGEKFLIGSGDECNLVIGDILVKEKHAIIEEKGGKYLLKPIATKNLFLNGNEISEVKILKDGDEIVVGSTILYFREKLDISETVDILRFKKDNGKITSKSFSEKEKKTKQIKKEKDLIENLPKLIVEIGRKKYSRPLLKDDVIIGSSNKCDIILEEDDISPKHAKVFREGGNFIIIDLESEIGTSVNGKKIFRRKLNSGDLIQIGNYKLKFIDPSQKKEGKKEKKEKSTLKGKKFSLKPFIFVFIAILFVSLIFLLIHLRREKCKNTSKAKEKIQLLIEKNQFEKALNLLEKISPCISQSEYHFLINKISMKEGNFRNFHKFEKALKEKHYDLASDILFYNIKDEKLQKEGKALLISSYIEESKKFFRSGNLSNLIDTCEKILHIEKDNLFALKMLSFANYRRKNFRETLSISKKILEREPLDEVINYIFFSSLYNLKKYNETVKYIDETLPLLKNKTPFYFLKAKALIMLGNLKRAKNVLKKIVNRKDCPPLARELYSQIVGESGKKFVKVEGRGINIKGTFIEKISPPVKNSDKRIVNLYISGKSDEIKEICSKSSSLKNCGEFLKIINLYQMGLKAFNEGKIFDSARFWLQVLKRERKLKLPQKSVYVNFILDRISNFLVERAKELMATQNYKSAYQLIEDVAYFNPENKKILNIKSRIEGIASRFYRAGFQYMEDGNYSEAKKNFEEVLKCITEDSLWYKKAAEKLEILQ